MLKILIVDDEKPICEWLAYTLHSIDFPCEIIGICHNGIDAQNMYSDKHPDVLITDIKMPIQDGITFLREILPAPNCYVVVLSNYDDFSYARETLTLGASEFILKTEIDKEGLSLLLTRAQKYLYDGISRNDKRNIPQVSHFLCSLQSEQSFVPENVSGLFKEYGITLEENNCIVFAFHLPVEKEKELEGILQILPETTTIVNLYLFYLKNEDYLIIGNISDRISKNYINSALRSFCSALYKHLQVPIGVSIPCC